jgi:hypothetical protein
VTIADGLEQHPYTYDPEDDTIELAFIPYKLDYTGETFEVGDVWWDGEYDGLAYLIVYSNEQNAYGKFKYGQKKPI